MRYASQEHEEAVTLAYDIGIPLVYCQPEIGNIVVGFDADGNVYIRFETRNWTSPVYHLPSWWCVAY